MQELKNYSKAIANLRLFEKANSKVFSEYEELQEEANLAKEELAKAVKENKESVENEFVEAKYIPTFKKFYGYEDFMENADKKEVDILKKAKGLKNEIDKKVFEELVKQGLISLETKSKCFTEKAGPISVRIIEK